MSNPVGGLLEVYEDRPQIGTEDDHSILRKEVEAAVQSLKKRKRSQLVSTTSQQNWSKQVERV